MNSPGEALFGMVMVIGIFILGAWWFSGWFLGDYYRFQIFRGIFGGLFFGSNSLFKKLKLLITTPKAHEASLAGFFAKRNTLHSANNGLRIEKNKHLSQKDSFNHLILVAPPGAGKTSCYVIPNTLKSDMSLVINDPKGEVFEKTSGHLKDRGFELWKIDLQNPYESAYFNPLLRTKKDPTKLRHLLKMIVGHTVSGRDKFWEEAAGDLLFTLATALTNSHNPAYINFYNLQYMVNTVTQQKTRDFIIKYLGDPFLFANFNTFLSSPQKTRGGVILVAQSSLAGLQIPALTHVFSGDTLDFTGLRKKPTAIYLIWPIKKSGIYNLTINLIFEEIFSTLLDMKYVTGMMPVAVLMDEAGQQKIEDFDRVATMIRFQNVSLSLILQDLDQLTYRYSEQAKNIIANSISTHLIFPGLPLNTCKMYSEIIGSRFVRVDDHKEWQALITTDGIRMLTDQIMISGNKPPIKVNMVPYYKDFELKRLAQKPPVRFGAVSKLIKPTLSPELI